MISTLIHHTLNFLFLAYNSQNKWFPDQQLLTKRLLNQNDVLFSFSQTLLTQVGPNSLSLQFTLKVEQRETPSEIWPTRHPEILFKNESPPTWTITDEGSQGWPPIKPGKRDQTIFFLKQSCAFQQGSQLRAVTPLCLSPGWELPHKRWKDRLPGTGIERSLGTRFGWLLESALWSNRLVLTGPYHDY